ncbi:hypothetical protein M9H77_29746 [Catharanthus roseus]|uniref:Uncharacterized protein n=1 Tax=Catharanthus roseus TaxID=4058 RepID=A0ACB9ZX84_CATRO|nr:hypothetical protein M9H77_29746 [Catharanthus roseus]
MQNFYHGGGNGFSADGGNNHRNGNFTLKRHNGVETSNVDSCENMNEKSIEKEDCNEIKEKERGEEKERLVERLCIFDSISMFSKESEYFECPKEKEVSLRKNFGDSSKDKDGRLTYKFDEYHFNIANYASCVLGVEDKGRNMEKELGTILEELPISLSLHPSLMCFNKDFENRMGDNLELFKVNPLAFEKSNYRKEAFEQAKIRGRNFSNEGRMIVLPTACAYITGRFLDGINFEGRTLLHLVENSKIIPTLHPLQWQPPLLDYRIYQNSGTRIYDLRLTAPSPSQNINHDYLNN